MLKQRVITAVVLVAALLGAWAWSPFAFAALMAIAFALAQAEWLRLAGWPFRAAAVFALALASLLLLGLMLYPGLVATLTGPLIVVATLLWLGIAVVLVRSERRGLVRIPRAPSTALAIVLPVAAWCALMQFLGHGLVMLLSVLAIVWLADTAAYFAGRAFGRSKLAARISPGKTWAGVWGAIAAVLGLALVLRAVWPEAVLYSTRLQLAFGPPVALAMLAFLVAISVVGDLFESLLKRQSGAKDSGHLLPGHGGFYDRLDAMLALLPPAAMFWRWAN